MPKQINSKAKGKRVELEAAAYLRSLGFDVYRTSQHRGGVRAADLCGPEGATLPVHIEVKGDRSIGLGTKALQDACGQAQKDSHGQWWCVLWHEHRRGWRLTTPMRSGTLQVCATVADSTIGDTVESLGLPRKATP